MLQVNFIFFNIEDGSIKWIYKTRNSIYSPAACLQIVSRIILFIDAFDRKLTAIDLKSGNVYWKTDKYQVRETIGISELKDKVLIRTMNDTILALPAARNLSEPLWITNCGFGYDISSAQIVEKDGKIFYPTKNGLLFALNSEDGKILWKYKVSNGFVNKVTPINKNHLLITAFDGKITFLSVNDK